MTMAVPQGNNATSTAEAAAAGRWRLQQQWWWQKQWEDNDGCDRQQRLQCRPGILLLSRMATGAMLTITVTETTDRMTKILAGNVSDMSASHRQGVKMSPNLGCMRVGADTKSTPTQVFCVGNHHQIGDTVVCTDTVIRTYCSTYVPQGVVAIQGFPQISATIILDKATFLITIEPVCVVVIAIWAALSLRIANNPLGSYVVQYYFLIVALPLLSQLLFSALHHKPQ
jgi:hypothetical protein